MHDPSYLRTAVTKRLSTIEFYKILICGSICIDKIRFKEHPLLKAAEAAMPQ